MPSTQRQTAPSAASLLALSSTLVILLLLSPQSNQQGHLVQALQAPASAFSLSSMEASQQQGDTVATMASPSSASHKTPLQARQFGDMISDIAIECNSNNIVVTLSTNHGFNGMIYPKGLSKNSSCMMEYHQMSSNITYYLPLRSCNTMSSNVDDGIEYFNTLMIQPHRRLVTNQGRGYHIRCRYQTKERTITNQESQLNVNLTQLTPAVVGSASMPLCTMKIYNANDLKHEVAAENVRIGDELHLVIALEDQDVYGMLVTNCLVRDGMNWGEQALIDEQGCPVDEEIMPQFVYASNLTRASVTFQAHKFPYTSSVYYQCNVRLCFRDGGCSRVPPNCDRPNYAQPNYRTVGGGAAVGGGGAPDGVGAGAGAGATGELGTNDLMAGGTGGVAVSGSGQTHSPQARRHKRWIEAGELDGTAPGQVLQPGNANSRKPMNIEVYSGLLVDESSIDAGSAQPAPSSPDNDPMMAASSDESGEATGASPPPAPASPSSEQAGANRRQSERDFCMSLRRFALIISLASLLLMAAVIIMIACMVHKRKRQRMEEEEAAANRHYGHSYYDGHRGPYANRNYCHD